MNAHQTRAWGSHGLKLAATALAAWMATGPALAHRPERFVEGELLIGLRAGVGPTGRFKLLREHGATHLEDIGRNGRVLRIRVPALAMDAMVRRLEGRKEIRFVEKNYEFEPALVPNDPQYASQWHLPQIQAPQAWDLTQGSAAGVIAIVDTGVDASHPELAGKLVPGFNFFDNNTNTADVTGHGTEVAGAAGAATNNATGVAGVAGSAPIMPVRVTSATGSATAARIASGIIWAADHGARVINLSFNGMAGNATITSAAQYAHEHGALVVAAAGNCGCVDATADNPYILSISATDEADGLAYFSSTGPQVDLSAPGNNIGTIGRFGAYVVDSGTSLASPVVAGVASLMFSANPSLTPTLATQVLESTAVDLGAAGYDEGFGHGRVNALAAVTAAALVQPPPDTAPPVVGVSPPANGATVMALTEVSVAALDDVGVTKVDLFVDGIYFATDTVSPYSFAWDTTAVANGPHTLLAKAYDAAGNVGEAAPVSVTVQNPVPDTTPPTLAITSPAAGATVSGSVSVTASAQDDVGVAKLEFFVDGLLNGTDTAAPYAFVWNTAGASPGAHTLSLVATDTSGNVASATRSVNIQAPNRAPVASNDAYTATYRSGTAYSAQVYAVLANDSDADGNLNTAGVKIVSAPNKGGTVKVNANGTVSYTPKTRYKGTETFRYTVSDSQGAVSNTATVTVVVQ